MQPLLKRRDALAAELAALTTPPPPDTAPLERALADYDTLADGLAEAREHPEERRWFLDYAGATVTVTPLARGRWRVALVSALGEAEMEVERG